MRCSGVIEDQLLFDATSADHHNPPPPPPPAYSNQLNHNITYALRTDSVCKLMNVPAIISNSSVRFSIHYNIQDMYMHTRPPFVLQGMVALPSFIILDFCVCNFNLVWSDSSSAELWRLVDTYHDTRIGAEVSAIKGVST